MALSASVDQVSEAILKELSSTEYACSSLEPLSGGNLNWVFRGRLKSPLPDGTEDVAIKRGEAFSLARPAFKLSTTRCVRPSRLGTLESVGARSTTNRWDVYLLTREPKKHV